MNDVQSAVESARQGYQTKSKGSKVQSALTTCSSRIMFYGGDSMGRHLKNSVLNHEELLVEISKAVSRIALVLPRTELHSVLYPTPRIQDAVSQLYAKIIEFAVMAIKCLGFNPIVEEIAERSKDVDELASAAVKAEIRDLHVNVHRQNETRLQLTEMVSCNNSSLSRHTLLALIEEHRQMFRVSQIEDIRTVALLEDTAVADDSLAWCRSMRNRRRQKAPTRVGVKTSSLDFAADFLDIVLEHGYPVIWALSSIVTEVDDDSLVPSVSGIIRSLISQALALNNAAVSEGSNPLTPKHFKSAVSIMQWFDILDRCVSSFQQIFIVLDMNVIEAAVEEKEAEDQFFKISDFVERVSRIAQSKQKAVKVIFASWRFNAITSLDAESIFDDRRLFTDRGRKIERLMKQPRFRAAFKRKHQNFHDKFRSSITLGDEDSRP
ncbi:hypothetical protein BDP81DRAFT_465152 [Colletotrichum phormii]|uniref:DUF7708 domain-containing protein n=1 Tax=Colletotrichum phormii TaxID=359342 RepID=A0AAI9ZGM2_9PEZI|nr:uncharacterized protein BDP81DRAFT_465152 [Colletotrichum phormii]KAK1623848.1 hypothetical protein BDP81DRAFT_465152 [Colletotrichum phormii]